MSISLEEGWLFTDHFLKQLNLEPLGETEHTELAHEVMANLFKLSNLLRKKSIDIYAQFLAEYFQIFLKYELYRGNINNKYQEVTREALICFFNVKGLLSGAQFR
jgi:hypothetical protein